MFTENEKYKMKWDSYEFHALQSRHQLYNEKLFTDVTLVSDDLEQFQAHKTILAAASSTFHSLLQINTQAIPLLYMKGVRRAELKALLEFIYTGETSVPVEFMDRFTQTATELGIYEQVQHTDGMKETNVKVEERNLKKPSMKKLDFLSNIIDSDNPNQYEDNKVGLSFLCNDELHEDNDDKTLEQPQNSLSIDNFFDNEDNEENVDVDDDGVDRDKKDYDKEREDDNNKDEEDEDVDLPGSTKKSTGKIKRKPEEPGYCSECDKHFTAKRSLKRHIAVVHELSQVFTCDICKKQYSGHDVFNKHKETHRATKDYGCPKCPKFFKTRDTMLSHLKTRHPLPSCTFHRIQFKNGEEMERHLKDEHLNKFC